VLFDENRDVLIVVDVDFRACVFGNDYCLKLFARFDTRGAEVAFRGVDNGFFLAVGLFHCYRVQRARFYAQATADTFFKDYFDSHIYVPPISQRQGFG